MDVTEKKNISKSEMEESYGETFARMCEDAQRITEIGICFLQIS